MFLHDSSMNCHISIEVLLYKVSVHQIIYPSVYLHVYICVCMCLGGIYVIAYRNSIISGMDVLELQTYELLALVIYHQ